MILRFTLAAACLVSFSCAAGGQERGTLVLELPSTGFENDAARRTYAERVDAFARTARKSSEGRDGVVEVPFFVLGDPLTPARVLVDGALLGSPEKTPGYWETAPEKRRPPYPFDRVAFVARKGLPNMGYPVGLPFGVPADRPIVVIEISVVEPGMAEHTPPGAKERLIDWLSPQSFLARSIVHRFLRGTRRATRAAELARTSTTSPELAAHAEIADKNMHELEDWARGYQRELAMEPFSKGDVRFDRAKRSPLRLLQYVLRAADALGDDLRPIAACTSLEDLHYALSRVWWFHRSQENEGVAILVQADAGYILGLSVAKDERTAPNGRQRAPIVVKPRFTPLALAEATFEEKTEFEGTRELLRHPRRVAEFYESMGWTCIFEDLAEVLELVSGRPLSASIAKQVEPIWSASAAWPVDEEHRFEELFEGPFLRPDSSSIYAADFYYDPERCTLDYTPAQILKQASSK